MNRKRLRARRSQWGRALALLLGACAAMPAGAQGTADPFVKPEFYIGSEGGEPPSLAAFAADPMQYLRSEEAYSALRQRFAVALGEDSLSETEFQTLFTEGRVRLRPCSEFEGFRTDGITPSGAVVRSPRTTCYPNEQFIELLVGSNWVLVASQGCFNPVRIVTRQPPPEPEAPQCRRVPMQANVIDGSMHLHSDGTWHPNCCCAQHGGHTTPSLHINIPSTQRAGEGYFMQCD